MYQQLIDHLRNKRIVLLGMGREGHSTYNFIRRYLPEQKLMSNLSAGTATSAR